MQKIRAWTDPLLQFRQESQTKTTSFRVLPIGFDKYSFLDDTYGTRRLPEAAFPAPAGGVA
jgi:hypothetical protein